MEDNIQNKSENSGKTGSDEHHKKAVAALMGRTRFFAIVVLFMGIMASSVFFYIGANTTKDDNEQFDRQASELVQELTSAWKEYETAGLWIHQACRKRDFTREDFTELYYYLKSNGLDFFAAEFIPNITHAERNESEQEMRAYLSETFPDLEYQGFKGFEPDPENQGELAVLPRSEQPFYFPVHFVEPKENGIGAHDFDLYSSATRRESLLTALDTWKPSLSARLVLVQESDKGTYSVLLFHPGIELPSKPEVRPRDLALMVIRIPALLELGVSGVQYNLQAFLYDSTPEKPEYLGAIKLELKDGVKQVTALPEIPYSETLGGRLVYQEELQIAASRTWKVVVKPIDDKVGIARFVIPAGVAVMLGAIVLAGIMYYNMKKTIDVNKEIERRGAAERAIVSSLFPSTFRDRILKDAATSEMSTRSGTQLQSQSNGTTSGIYDSKPIADLFLETTIFFADLVGFTAWSSVREPAQVFMLLETIYHSFDMIAMEVGNVFKVETVGDSYVAVSGLPEPHPDHAIYMARFAVRSLFKMHSLVKELEIQLGPDTADLDMRIGLHTGQVIAGVLRGQRGRFQLFGDTMNTASRMESTSNRGQIQVSEETATTLTQRGKGHWLQIREDKVYVKGKGEYQTYWLKTQMVDNVAHDVPMDELQSELALNSKTKRLIKWNVEVLASHLRKIKERRIAMHKLVGSVPVIDKKDDCGIVDEVEDVICMPEFKNEGGASPEKVDINEESLAELHSFVTVVASLYNDNPFHNFEHASHVTMSATKLLSRIVAPKLSDNDDDNEKTLHDHTYGITSDPLTQFACVFSALIHDIDHQGVPNATLVEEESYLAKAFEDKSVAEQNSFHIAWDLLMSDEYANLRKCIYADVEEQTRFRQLLVNSIMATDISDKDLASLRKLRWSYAFDKEAAEDATQKSNRRATIVIEHLIQASDVSHTMQHWHVYIKWNERLFQELMQAYEAGRLNFNPAENWAKGELGFFDFYVIPLAKKLETCGVFGVSSAEFLNYAMMNRAEWELKGQETLEKFIANYKAKKAESVPESSPLSG